MVKNEMKNKLKTKTILIALMILLVPLASTNTLAYSGELTTTQSPSVGNVREGDIVIVTVTLYPEDDDDYHKTLDTKYTRLEWLKNGVEQTNINANEVLPARLSEVTFTLGSFITNTQIKYRVRLALALTIDYESSWITFTVYPVDIPTTDDPVEELPGWIVGALICVGALIVLIGLAYVFKRRR